MPEGAKKILLSFFLIFLIFCLSLSQEIIKNPRKPLSKSAGRIIQLERVWQIGDREGKFYFRFPRDLKIASSGEFFIADREQLLKFSPDGRFLRNLYKKGQGPGEIQDYFIYHLWADKLYVFDPLALKLIQLDLEGNVITHFKLEGGPYSDFCGVNDRWLIFMNKIYPPLEARKEKLHDLPCSIELISHDGSKKREAFVFTQKTFLAPKAAASWDPWYSLLSQDGRRLYVCHSREYLIEALDIETGKIIYRFNRDFSRVRHTEQVWEKDFRRKYNFPKIKYEPDIRGLFLNGHFIWVKTAVSDEKKGDMFDVFDEKGRFVDNFYLGQKGSLLAVQEGFLYLLEKDEDENLFIAKYKIID